MSSLALMRWLESAPERYDSGMRLLTLGRVSALHDTLARTAVSAEGSHVLEIGCGTGSVTRLLVQRGARVTALDQNPEMLEQARRRLADASPGRAELIEQTACEIDTLPDSHYDAVVASLSLSEMSRSERAFVLREARRRLRPGGLLVVGDEVVPHRKLHRFVHSALRAPQALLGWLLTGSVSHPIPDLVHELRQAGMEICGEQRWLLAGLAVVTARRKP